MTGRQWAAFAIALVVLSIPILAVAQWDDAPTGALGFTIGVCLGLMHILGEHHGRNER